MDTGNDFLGLLVANIVGSAIGVFVGVLLIAWLLGVKIRLKQDYDGWR